MAKEELFDKLEKETLPTLEKMEPKEIPEDGTYEDGYKQAIRDVSDLIYSRITTVCIADNFPELDPSEEILLPSEVNESL